MRPPFFQEHPIDEGPRGAVIVPRLADADKLTGRGDDIDAALVAYRCFDLIVKGMVTLSESIRQNSGYLARAEIAAIIEKHKNDGRRVEAFGFKVYSQGDEDGIIEEIFNRLEIDRGRFCEIGVENGLECNTLYLIHKGWKGCWVEGNQDQKRRIEERFASIIGTRLKLVFEYVTANSILSGAGFGGEEIDFLSIDIDGNDIYLLRALEARPKVICIEYNSKFPSWLSKTPVYSPRNNWDGTDFMGSSLKAISEVASEKGYRLVGTSVTGVNAFLVRSDLAKDLFPENDSPEYLYNPPRYWLISDHFSRIGHPAGFGRYADLHGADERGDDLG